MLYLKAASQSTINISFNVTSTCTLNVVLYHQRTIHIHTFEEPLNYENRTRSIIGSADCYVNKLCYGLVGHQLVPN